jgi:hypothetical protein
MFLVNKYSKWYFSIIENAKNRTTAGYIEKHHIIPKSMDGDNSAENLVNLTAKEHFICHLLLTKMTTGNYNKKMLFAFRQMSMTGGNQERYKINSRMFTSIKKLIKHTEESKKKMSESHLGLIQTAETIEKRVGKIRGKPLPIKGRSTQTFESKLLISEGQITYIGNLTVEEKKIRLLNSFHNPEIYTEARAAKISKSLSGKPKSEAHKQSMSKKYIFISPLGEIFEYIGIAAGCQAHNLNIGTVKNYLMVNKSYKGWEIKHGK